MSKGTYQQVILIGNLCADPEIRYSTQGVAMASVSVATSNHWADKASGEKKEKTEFHRVKLFGKTAEIAGEYMRKGSKVHVVGELQTSKWQDQNGQDRYTTEVVVQGFNGVMQMLGGSKGGNQGMDQQQQQQGGWNQPQQPAAAPQQQQQNYAPQQQQQAPKQQQAAQQAPQQQYSEPPMDFDDDIPF